MSFSNFQIQDKFTTSTLQQWWPLIWSGSLCNIGCRKIIACEQALWLGKERRQRKSKETKGRERAKRRGGGGEGRRGEREGGDSATLSSSPVYARLADLFSRFFPAVEPVHCRSLFTGL